MVPRGTIINQFVCHLCVLSRGHIFYESMRLTMPPTWVDLSWKVASQNGEPISSRAHSQGASTRASWVLGHSFDIRMKKKLANSHGPWHFGWPVSRRWSLVISRSAVTVRWPSGLLWTWFCLWYTTCIPIISQCSLSLSRIKNRCIYIHYRDRDVYKSLLRLSWAFGVQSIHNVRMIETSSSGEQF